ncbi:MAG: hypothetical protein INQ03_16575 [Candidatus Heimdallarchaeota archaeon]|nr:hypothetical protein [Candidatus Heimdallarchaeota archaeon]
MERGRSLSLFVITILIVSMSFSSINSQQNNSEEKIMPIYDNLSQNSSPFVDQKIHKVEEVSQPIDRVDTQNKEITEKSTTEINKGLSLDASTSEFDVLKVLYKNTSSGQYINHGVPGMELEVCTLVQGPINEDFDFSLRGTSGSGSDLKLTEYYYDLDLTSSQTLWINITYTLHDLTTINNNDIRFYYIFMETPTWNVNIYDGRDESRADAFRLYVKGSIAIDKIVFFNNSIASDTKISLAQKNWKLVPRFYFQIINAPIWGFTLDPFFKNDIVWGIDTAATYNGLDLTLTDTYDQGNYYWTPYNSSSLPAQLIIDPSRTYGTGLFETRGIFGGISDNLDGSYNEAPYLESRSESTILVTDDIKYTDPVIKLITPNTGKMINNSEVYVYALIESSLSNGLIESILINETEVISDYNPWTTELTTIYNISNYTEDTIYLLNITVIDKGGRTTSELIYLQSNIESFFEPHGYKSDISVKSNSIFTFYTSFSTVFSYLRDDVNISLIPKFEISLEINQTTHTGLSIPEEFEGGIDETIFLMMKNPSLSFKINLKLSLNYIFQSENYFFAGSWVLYDDNYFVLKIIELGVKEFHLNEFIDSDILRKITHFEVDVIDILPSYISWLGNLVLSLDIDPYIKLISSMKVDLQIDGGTASQDSFIWNSEGIKYTEVTPDPSYNGNTSVTITNVQLELLAGFQVDFILTLNGNILGYQITSVNLNDWLRDYFGIIIPVFSRWFDVIYVDFPDGVSLTSYTLPTRSTVQLIGHQELTTSQKLRFNYSTSLGNIENAVVNTTFLGATYTATEIGNGLYELVLPLTSANTTIQVNFTRIYQQSKYYNIYLSNIISDGDIISPSIDSLSHTSGSITNSTQISISASITDNVEVYSAILYYSTNGGISWNSILMSNPYTVNLGTFDPNTILCYYVNASDTSGNFIVSPSKVLQIEEFVGDITYPVVTSISITSGINTEYSLTEVNVDIVASDDVAISVIKLFTSYNGGSTWIEDIIDGNNLFFTLGINSAPEMLLYYVEVTDTSFNTYRSLAKSHQLPYIPPVIDTNLPELSDLRHNNGEITDITEVIISATASDDISIGSVILYYSIDAGSTWITETMTLSTEYTVSIGTFEEGVTVLYYVNVTDTSDNFQVSSSKSFTVQITPKDSTSPVINSINHDPSIITASTQVVITAVATDNVAIDSVILFYTQDGGITWLEFPMFIDEVYTATIGSFAEGTIVTYYVNATDTSGNEKVSTSHTFIVQVTPGDSTPPVISSVTHTPTEITSSTLVEISAIVTDNVEVTSVKLYYSLDGGSAWNTTQMIFENVYAISIGSFPEGSTVLFYINATDSSNNYFVSASKFFTVQITPTDIEVPEIFSISHGPAEINETTIVSIFATVLDNIEVEAVVLYFSTDAGISWTSISMIYNSEYMANIGPFAGGVSVLYYINATDISENYAISITKAFKVDSSIPTETVISTVTETIEGTTSVTDTTTEIQTEEITITSFDTESIISQLTVTNTESTPLNMFSIISIIFFSIIGIRRKRQK